jgi:uncharacterized protein (TIGR03118 family)
MKSRRRSSALRQARLSLEALEDRCLLSANVLQTNLVSDLPGVAAIRDPHLVNPWGISESSNSAFWISENNAGVSTLYNVPGASSTPVSIVPLVVSIPTPGNPLGSTGAPTGTVFNLDLGGGGFKVSGVDAMGHATSAPAVFLFATEDGTIVGWNPGVNPVGFDPAKAGTYGIIAVDNSTNPTAATGAVYKGLSIATSATPIFAGDAASTTVLYAANFRSGQIEVYDSNFKPVMLPAGAFSDPNLPKGYAPFNVQVLNGKVYVTYALQNAAKHDDVAGLGHGFVDVFNLNGTPGLAMAKERLISHGALDSPWGLAIAPTSFGNLGGKLLVGNFGNGLIHVYDPTTGALVTSAGDPHGALLDPDGEPIQINGLWTLRVGNDNGGGSSQTIYFSAGIDDEKHGLFGSLKPVAAGTPEGRAEAQMATAALDVAKLDLATVESDIKTGAPVATLTQDLQTFSTDVVTLAQTEVRLELDIISDHDGANSPDVAAEQAIDDFFADLASAL